MNHAVDRGDGGRKSFLVTLSTFVFHCGGFREGSVPVSPYRAITACEILDEAYWGKVKTPIVSIYWILVVCQVFSMYFLI